MHKAAANGLETPKLMCVLCLKKINKRIRWQLNEGRNRSLWCDHSSRGIQFVLSLSIYQPALILQRLILHKVRGFCYYCFYIRLFLCQKLKYLVLQKDYVHIENILTFCTLFPFIEKVLSLDVKSLGSNCQWQNLNAWTLELTTAHHWFNLYWKFKVTLKRLWHSALCLRKSILSIEGTKISKIMTFYQFWLMWLV